MGKAPETQGAIAAATMGERKETNTPSILAKFKRLGVIVKAKRAFPSWRGLRLKWAFTTKGLSYSSSIIDQIYRIYLSHNKVIHFRDGFPVFSLSTPAAFSKPAANFLARSLFRTIQNKNIPNLMSFAVNDVCNASCGFCSFFEGVEDSTKSVLTLDQSKRLIAEAQELGVSVINFVGGEPLMRNDLPDIIGAVDKDLSTTLMFTNGWLLEQKVEVLKQAGLDSVYISLDSADPEAHDLIRGVPGLFSQAVKGIKKAGSLGLSTGISCCITPEAFERGVLGEIVELGRRIGIHEVLVFDALPTGRCKAREDLVDNFGWVEEMIASIKPYNESAAYPGVVAYSYMTSHRSVGCSCGTSYFYVSPYGDIMSCDFNHALFGNVLERPLYEIWDIMTNTPEFRSAKWGGCKIKDSRLRATDKVSPGNPVASSVDHGKTSIGLKIEAGADV